MFRLIEVAEGEGDQRLDRWFRRRFPQISQGRIEKLCRKGEIRVDGGRVKASTRVEAGQTVRVPPLPDTAAPARDKLSDISAADVQMMRDAVIYRDDHMIALNKPPGLPSQGGSKQTRHVDGLSEAFALWIWMRNHGLCTGLTKTHPAFCCWRARVRWRQR